MLISEITNKSNFTRFYYPEYLNVGSKVEASISTGFLRFLPENKLFTISIWMSDIFPSLEWTTTVKNCEQLGYGSFFVEVESDAK